MLKVKAPYVFNSELLQLAREERGLSQKSLALALAASVDSDLPRKSFSQSEISKFESGDKVPTMDFVRAAAYYFGYTEEFFLQTSVALPSGLPFHRKRQALPAMLRNKIEAEAKLRALDVHFLVKRLNVSPSDIPLRLGRTPKEMAQVLRDAWDVPRGPIENLVALLEEHRIFILSFDFQTDLLDAFFLPSAETDGILCIAFNTNANLSPDRNRFTLAHELGHAILHHGEIPNGKKHEDEANEFAGEFLAPEQDIHGSLTGTLTFSHLAELKKKWKISIAGLLMRSEKVKAQSIQKTRRIWIFLSKSGYRKKEPSLGLTREIPTKIDNLIMRYVSETRTDLLSELYLTRERFLARYPRLACIAEGA